jgi:arabinofuranan 3-O-arabinosyltransferase
VRQWVAALALVALAFSQRPGLIVGDTKANLILSPGSYLARALSAWDPHAAFGQLQNQAYGYLFPMGPFFLLGHVLEVPGWIIQRAWWSLLLVVAFAGCLRVARLLEVGTPTSRLIAALAYALSPRVLTVIGEISVEALPLAMLPWVLAPLIAGSRGGSPRRAAMRSSVAVACIGGVNAAATLAVLPLPLLFLLTRSRAQNRARLLLWWVLGVALATAWWVLPLLVLERYAFPFLDYIETASITTSVESLTNVLRGTSHWLAYLSVRGQPFWPAGWQLATAPVQVLATGLLGAAGLIGLTSRRMRERRFLVLAMLIGTVLIAIGYAGPVSSPLSSAVRSLLDGPLAAFRNVHKFDPLIRLPLALGLASLPTALPFRATVGRGRLVAASVVVGAVLLGASGPALQGRLAPAGGFAEVPTYWRQAARWLSEQPGEARALLVPPSNFAEYTWGRPMDEPLDAWSTAPWAVRNAVPLGAPGATRLLDALDLRLASGEGSSGLAPALARAGVGYVVLRHDLDRHRTGAPPPEVLHSALERSPGLRLVAAFGPSVGPPSEARERTVEIFAVDRSVAPATAYPASQTVVLSGGPEAALPLADLGIDGPVIAAADATGVKAAVSVVTDTLRRRSLNFGADPGSNYSPTLTAGQSPARGRPAGDVLPYSGESHETVARLLGATSVSASSSAADPFLDGYRGPQYRPAAAFDGDVTTAWVSAGRPVGEWVAVDVGRRVTAAGVRIRMVVDPLIGPPVTSLEVRTDTGAVVARLQPTSAAQYIALPPGSTRTFRFTVRAVAGADTGAVGIASIEIPGVAIHETLRVPTDQTGELSRRPAAFVFNRAEGYRGNCYLEPSGWQCQPRLAQPGEDAAGLDRTFDLPRTTVDASVTVRPRPGPQLDGLLDASLGYRASASSVLVPDPAARPGAAFDGDPATAWISAADDVNPRLVLDLPHPVSVSQLGLSGSQRDLARIRRVVIDAGGVSRVLTYHRGEVMHFQPLRGRRITVGFVLAAESAGAPLRLAEVSLGLPIATGTGQVRVPYSDGPTITVDGRVESTSVTVDVARLLDLSPVPAQLLVPRLSMSGATHRLVGGATDAFEIQGVVLGDSAALRPATGGSTRAVEVLRWAAENRTLRVSAGPTSYLALDEGANPGWRATLAGRTLRPMRLDGWRQAWVLPASASPTRIELTFEPGRWHRAGLLTGAACLLLLTLLALVPGRTAPRTSASKERALAPALRDRSLSGAHAARPWVAWIALVVAGVVVVGPWGGVVAALACALPSAWRPVGAGVALAAAACWAVVADSMTTATGQVLAAAAVALSGASLADGGVPLRRLWVRFSSGRSTAPHDTAATATVQNAVNKATPTK